MSNPTSKNAIFEKPDQESSSSDEIMEIPLDVEIEDDNDNLVGKVLGNYRLIAQIGEGASAVVYRAEHVQLGVSYAIKILHPAILSRKGMRERFLREARAAGQLRHENVVFIADFAIDSNFGPYMVMEYLEGETLQSVLEREGALDLDRVRGIARQTCQALALAHEHGIIHRDLKPENIFLIPRKNREVVKILDFGIARLAQSNTTLTGAGHIIGTPLYMSPEQCRGNVELTRATDVYSFGVMLYQMLIGRTPFEGDNPQKLIIDHFLVPPPELGPEFPDALRVLQAKLLTKNPEERPQSMEEVWEGLAQALRVPDGSETSDQLPDAFAHVNTEASPSTPSKSSPVKQTNTWTNNFQSIEWNAHLEDPASPSSDNHPHISIQQNPPSRQTLELGSDVTAKKKNIGGHRALNDPARQTMETNAFQTSSVVVEQKRKAVIQNTKHKQHNPGDPLLQDLEQIFSAEPGSASSAQDPPTDPGRVTPFPSDPDAELLKDLDMLNAPSSKLPNPWEEEPVIELWKQKERTNKTVHPPNPDNAPNNFTGRQKTKPNNFTAQQKTDAVAALAPPNAGAQTPQGTGNFLPPSPGAQTPQGTGNFLPPTVGPQLPQGTGNFQPPVTPPPVSSFGLNAPTEAKILAAPDEGDESHTEIDLSAVSSADIDFTREDVELANRLREVEKNQAALAKSGEFELGSPDLVFQQGILGNSGTEIDLSLYPPRKRRKRTSPLWMVLLFAGIALGAGYFLWTKGLLFFLDNTPPPPSTRDPLKTAKAPPKVPAALPNPTGPKVCIKIDSKPAQAIIYTNNEVFGLTPAKACRPVGTKWLLTIKKKAYLPRSKHVTFKDAKQIFQFRLKRKK